MTKKIDTERLITIAQAAKWFEGRTGKKPSVAAIYRWVGRGVKGRRLESVRAGRDLFTSEEACSRYMHGPDPEAVVVVTVQAAEPVRVTDGTDADVLERRVFRRKKGAAT